MTDAMLKWIEYIKTNPDWRRQHNRFINSQLINANRQLCKLGKNKLIDIFGIKNKKVLEQL